MKPITLFMTDLETTGTDAAITEIMEIASVEVEFDGFKLTPKSHFHEYIHINTKPDMNDKFVVEHQLGLYDKCLSVDPVYNSKKAVSKRWNGYLKEKSNGKKYQFSGLNFGSFDEQFLLVHEFLPKSKKDIENGGSISEYTYRHLEIQSFIQVGSMQLGMTTTDFSDYMVSLDDTVQLPEGSAHTALYDCYRQIKLINSCLKFVSFKIGDK